MHDEWIIRAVNRLLADMDDIEGDAMQAGQSAQDPQADIDVWQERFSAIIATEHSRWLCERLNRLPMYGNDWGDIADELGLSVHRLNGFAPKETT